MERTIKPEALQAELPGKHIIDVRRSADREGSAERLPNSVWRDPNDIAHWSQALPADSEIVIYCVRGGSVSNSVVDALQDKGLKARYIEGGIEGWKAAGGAIIPK